jgi:hypothetical protein
MRLNGITNLAKSPLAHEIVFNNNNPVIKLEVTTQLSATQRQFRTNYILTT